ncbi:MAG: OmpA family protein [Gammaproteobacteria bacterium]|nr:OmpA family protein [Gammaproteobacteria bacterium]
MKRSKGNIIYTIIPVLILGAAAAGGWYYYYAEANKNKTFEKDSRSELSSLTRSLEKAQAENKELQAALEQEVAKTSLTTEELKAELEKRQLAQQSLKNEISSVSEEKSELLSQLEQEQESKRQIAHLKNRLEQELNESRVEITQLKNQMTVIKLTSEVLFGSGSAEITPAGKKVLSIIADSLNAYPDRAITVEGHTDNIPILQYKKYDSNWELSTARGIAAIQFFQQNNQVDPQRLKVVGYGQYRPVASNDSAEGRQLNRRIEIKLSPPG